MLIPDFAWRKVYSSGRVMPGRQGKRLSRAWPTTTRSSRAPRCSPKPAPRCPDPAPWSPPRPPRRANGAPPYTTCSSAGRSGRVSPSESTSITICVGTIQVLVTPALARSASTPAGSNDVAAGITWCAPRAVVASAWNHQIKLERADDAQLPQFISRYKNNPSTTPEFGAMCFGGVSTTADRPLSVIPSSGPMR